MKKAYVNPEIEIVKIQTQQMMAGSTVEETMSPNDVKDGFKQYSRSGRVMDWDDEE